MKIWLGIVMISHIDMCILSWLLETPKFIDIGLNFNGLYKYL